MQRMKQLALNTATQEGTSTAHCEAASPGNMCSSGEVWAREAAVCYDGGALVVMADVVVGGEGGVDGGACGDASSEDCVWREDVALESFQRIYAGLVLENPPRGDARDKALVELVTDATDVAPVHDASDDCVQAVQWYFEQEREALSVDLGGPSSVMSRLLLWDTGKKVGLLMNWLYLFVYWAGCSFVYTS